MTQDVFKYLQPNAAVPIDMETTSLLVNALRQTIKELESQEPVAWPCLIAEADFSQNTVTLTMQCTDYKISAGKHWLFTNPPQRTELAPEGANSKQYLERLIRIMGTFDLATGHADTFDELLDSLESELRDVLGYYRQQRTWVGLTPEEILDMFDAENVYGSKWLEFARALEAKLKQKNGFAEEKNT